MALNKSVQKLNLANNNYGEIQMSYCVALKLSRGLLFMSDTLTNGGVDDISSYPKTFSWGVPGERQILLTAAGNLATSQAAVNTLSENIKNKKMDENITIHRQQKLAHMILLPCTKLGISEITT